MKNFVVYNINMLYMDVRMYGKDYRIATLHYKYYVEFEIEMTILTCPN